MKNPCLLQEKPKTSNFDCGVEALNTHLKHYARQAQKREGARTYVVVKNDYVVAYYTIVFGGIAWKDAPDHVRKGLGKYPIPVMIIARLAVDKNQTGKGLGNSLLLDAVQKAIAASEIAGLRAVVVDAKDETTKRFYEKRGFRTWPYGSNRLFVTLLELKKESL